MCRRVLGFESMPKVAVSRPLPGTFDVPGAEVAFGPRRGFESLEDMYSFVRGSDAYVSWFTDPIDDAFLDAAGEQLRLVAQFAVGYDNIDIEACARRGVIVTNTPDAVTEGTADMAMCLMLGAARRLAHADSFARTGQWVQHGPLGPDEFIGKPLSGATLLIVGAGRIGYATAIRTLGWGMNIHYHARSPKHVFEGAPLNATYEPDLDTALPKADFVSIHTPLTEDTRHLIDARRLALMKPSAVLVNTSRGPVVDESALVEALRENRLFAAGLDVFEREPALAPGLAELDNVVLAPHIGSASEGSRFAMTALCQANVRAVLDGRDPVTPVTPPEERSPVGV